MDYLPIVIILVFCSLLLFFVLSHLRPLTEEEVRVLGNKRRKRQIRIYFSFDSREFKPNSEFKKSMKADGSFYNIEESLYEFPSSASAL